MAGKKGAKKGVRRKASNPCNPKNSTGAKASGGAKSVRAKSFKESRHPRKKGGKQAGQMATTSAASKKKYGKGGTTKSKQMAACRRKAS
jgi:hypothetical protein